MSLCRQLTRVWNRAHTCIATCSVSGENLLRLSALPAVLVWVSTLQSAPGNPVRIHRASRKKGGREQREDRGQGVFAWGGGG